MAEPTAEIAQSDGVRVNTLWKRNPPGREVVRIERVWMYSALGDPAVLSVRAQPTHGGRPIVAPVTWLRERYTEVVLPSGSAGGVS